MVGFLDRVRGARGTGPHEFVAIDLETTGVNPSVDRIIEIGATRFDRSGSREAFQSFRTFVQPGRAIPPEIQALTSITERDVAEAPTPSLAVAQLASFVGGRAIVGQNVRFDLEFLSAYGFEPRGGVYDTWDLASVLLPTADRLNLGSLCGLLGVTVGHLHRALDDAEATRDVFLALLGRLERLPRATLVDLAGIAASAGWTATDLIGAAIDLDRAGGALERRVEGLAVVAPGARGEPWAPVEPRTDGEQGVRGIEAVDIDALFALARSREDVVPGYEERAGQREMARAVGEALAAGGRLAVEAGTGTGKSLAYLLPSMLHAVRTGERTVVSTHTINLQQQLAARDIPAAARLVEVLEGLEAGSVRATVLKGRSNYLCLERWTERRHDARPRTLAEARLHGRIATWLPQTETGDLGELYMSSDERGAWAAISAADGDCLSRRCAFVRDGSCFLLRARQRATGAHVVVVNHALLLADAASGAGVLPRYEHLVLDEAHRLEDVATNQYGSALSLRELRVLLDEIASGVASQVRGASALDPSPLSPLAVLAHEAEAIARAARAVREATPPLERALGEYVDERRESDRGLDEEIPLTSARHSQPLWEDVGAAAVEVDYGLLALGRAIERARGGVQALPPGTAPGLERLAIELGRAWNAVQGAREALVDGVLGHGDDAVRWLRVGESDMRLLSAPLDVADRLEGDVWGDRRAIIATSATLGAGGALDALERDGGFGGGYGGPFEFALRPLGLDDAEPLEIPSPYDYRRSVLALVVTDVPEPDAPGHISALNETLAVAVAAAEGRTLALFTSHGAVRGTAAALRTPLGRLGIGVLAQQVDGTPARLVESLIGEPRTLLLGTAALWEGVDVRGDALSQVVVTRLPFPVPSDPVHAGRAALTSDGFAEYALPQALLRFRQGFGRLIRGSDERGVFLVLDRRVVTRRYGEAFLDALPDCEVRRVSTRDLDDAIRSWLEPRA